MELLALSVHLLLGPGIEAFWIIAYLMQSELRAAFLLVLVYNVSESETRPSVRTASDCPVEVHKVDAGSGALVLKGAELLRAGLKISQDVVVGVHLILKLCIIKFKLYGF